MTCARLILASRVDDILLLDPRFPEINIKIKVRGELRNAEFLLQKRKWQNSVHKLETQF